MRSFGRAALAAASLAVLGACAARAATAPAPDATAGAWVPAPMPSGSEGELIRYGRDLLDHTQTLAKPYVTAGMSCSACHIDAGTKAHGGSFVGTYARFPQWNTRSHRYIMVQDRLAECFLYSMNGRPPAYASRAMVALSAYLAWLSRGVPVGATVPGQGYEAFAPDRTPDAHAGAQVYAARCTACHGADGSGRGGAFPPLWGARSFNDGAGMHRITTMAQFVRYNMPYGSPPNTLSRQQAYDVAAFVLAHPRPHFDTTRLVQFPARAAGTF